MKVEWEVLSRDCSEGNGFTGTGEEWSTQGWGFGKLTRVLRTINTIKI